MKRFRSWCVGLILVLSACGDDAASVDCSPACMPGEVCSFGVCVVRCNPPCASNQRCVAMAAGSVCLDVDAGNTDAGGTDASEVAAAPDAMLLDVPFEEAMPNDGTVVKDRGPVDDTSDDTPVVDDISADIGHADVTSVRDVSAVGDALLDVSVAMDAPHDVPVAMDAPRDEPVAVDAPRDVPMVMDVPRDMPVVMDVPRDMPVVLDIPRDMPVVMDVPRDMPVVMDVPRDVPFVPAVCGGRAQACCGPAGMGFACRAGNVCDLSGGRRCTDPARVEGECVDNTDCAAGRVCMGPRGCAERWCYRCGTPAPSAGAAGAACNPDMQGRDCVTGVCRCDVFNSMTGQCTTARCAWACSPGAPTEAECNARQPGSRCLPTFFYPAPTPAPQIVTALGTCVTNCVRNSNCAAGEACIYFDNVFEDRVDSYCARTTRPGAAGASCTSPGVCQSLLCVGIPSGSRVCSAPCVTDADCPAAAPVCTEIDLERPNSRTLQAARACLPRLP